MSRRNNRKDKIMKHTLFALMAFFAFAPGAFAATPQLADNVVGTVLSVEGKATLTPAGSPRSTPVSTNAPVRPGDLLETSDGSRLFLQMIDNTELTLGENGKMRVDDYVFDQKHEDKSRAVYSIAKGAFLFVDGLIGKKRNPNIQVNIPVGSIGIRGTKFWGGEIDGAYGVIVGEGEVTVKNARGSVSMKKGEGTTVASINSRPDTPRAWAPEKLKRATAAVALQDPAEIGKRMQENAERNKALRARHEQAVKALENRQGEKAGTGGEESEDTKKKRREFNSLNMTPPSTTIGGNNLSMDPPVQSLIPGVSTAPNKAGSNLSPVLGNTNDGGSTTGGEVRETIRETVKETVQDSKESGSSVRETVKETTSAVKETVRETVQETKEKTKTLNVLKKDAE